MDKWRDLPGVIIDLNAACPDCGYDIKPGEMLATADRKLKCPKCGHIFTIDHSAAG